MAEMGRMGILRQIVPIETFVGQLASKDSDPTADGVESVVLSLRERKLRLAASAVSSAERSETTTKHFFN